ncbi:MAG TPA: radical SAM protein [Desulfovibrio sp.]|nr:radical SAM protein [Desulfovibrio sp.]
MPSLPLFFGPRWDWLQLEVTSRCNAACGYCPRTVYRESWRSRDMDWDTFQRLVPEFRRTSMVHLQGWGEPLLHPRFFDMLAAVKRAGVWAGTTSNGLLIDEDTAARLAASGLDMLAVSLAGTGEDHDRARAGAGLEATLAALRRVDQAKQRLGSATPALHVAFMLLRSGLPGLRRLPGLLAGTGVGQVVVSSLDYVCSAELAGEVLTSAQVLEAEDNLRKTAQEAAAQGLALSWLLPRERAGSAEFCSENVDRALVVAVDGAVHPCVSASLAANRGAAASAEALVFGSVREKSLSDIWVSKEYKAFRKSFGSGDRPLVCRSCPKLRVA